MFWLFLFDVGAFQWLFLCASGSTYSHASTNYTPTDSASFQANQGLPCFGYFRFDYMCTGSVPPNLCCRGCSWWLAHATPTMNSIRTPLSYASADVLIATATGDLTRRPWYGWHPAGTTIYLAPAVYGNWMYWESCMGVFCTGYTTHPVYGGLDNTLCPTKLGWGQWKTVLHLFLPLLLHVRLLADV